MASPGQINHTVHSGRDCFFSYPRHFVPGRLRRLRRTLSLAFRTTNRYDRDVGLAESGYYQLVPPGQKTFVLQDSPTDAALRNRMRPLWKCPKCSRNFANRNQEHSCGQYSVKDFLRGRTQKAIAIYRAFEKLVLGLGTIILAPAKTRVGFQARMIFAAVNKLTADKLHAHVVLARRLESPRFTKIETISARNHVHHFTIGEIDELNDEVRTWLREAYQLGMQKHLQRTPRDSPEARRHDK